jgi:hypothetical protein
MLLLSLWRKPHKTASSALLQSAIRNPKSAIQEEVVQ